MFYYSSRRRHTSWPRDWSSDVCSSDLYLIDKFGRTRGQGWSYGGYEKNRLYLNQGGESFTDKIGRASCRGKSVKLGSRSFNEKKNCSMKRNQVCLCE